MGPTVHETDNTGLMNHQKSCQKAFETEVLAYGVVELAGRQSIVPSDNFQEAPEADMLALRAVELADCRSLVPSDNFGKASETCGINIVSLVGFRSSKLLVLRAESNKMMMGSLLLM